MTLGGVVLLRIQMAKFRVLSRKVFIFLLLALLAPDPLYYSAQSGKSLILWPDPGVMLSMLEIRVQSGVADPFPFLEGSGTLP